MTDSKFFKTTGVITAFVAVVVAGMVTNSRRVIAHDDDDERDEARVHRGFEIAPVPLDLVGKNRSLVGLGSYIVNAVGDCNGCHSAGPATEFAMGGNPYFNQKPTKVNPNTYLGGGRHFVLIPGPPGMFPDIISRNLTPDKTAGLKEETLLRSLKPSCGPASIRTTCIRPAPAPPTGNASRLRSTGVFFRSCRGRSIKT